VLPTLLNNRTATQGDLWERCPAAATAEAEFEEPAEETAAKTMPEVLECQQI
jgi:hypothetical protein